MLVAPRLVAIFYAQPVTSTQKPVYFAKNSNYLRQPPDTKPIGLPFVELQSIDSTNNYARQQIHAGLAQHGMAVFSHEQLMGKGQRGKTWSSEREACIILSIVLKPYPFLLLSQQFILNACVSVAINDFFKKYAGTDTKIKWPNDLYWQDRKAGGVLIESIVGSLSAAKGLPTAMQVPGVGNWEWAIVGIGININQTTFPGDLPNPVSLKQITGKDFNVVELAKELCDYIEKYFQKLINEDFSRIHDRYVAQLYKKNSTVKLKKGNRIFETRIKSVSPSGKLIVQHAMEEEFDFGEVEWMI